MVEIIVVVDNGVPSALTTEYISFGMAVSDGEESVTVLVKP